MTIYQLELTIRSPLHIGSGGAPLRNGVDFAAFGRWLYVLNVDAVLDFILPDDPTDPRFGEIMRSRSLADFLTQADLQQHPELVVYRLGGSARQGEILPQIKDVWAQPYIPGSTLKGAIRTALGTALARDRAVRLSMAQLGQRREWAGRELEQSLFGRAPRPAQMPNYDLLRTIQVADSAPVAADALELSNVAVWPAGERGIPIDVETIHSGTVFTARLKVDDYLLSPQANELGFGVGIDAIRRWVTICREHGIEQIRQEARFFRERAPQVERFYAELVREAEQGGPDVFFAHVGWGAGWNAKTLSRVIRPNQTLLAEIIRRYRLVRGVYRPGAPFPGTRRVVVDRGQPLLPLGWVQVQVNEVAK